MLVKQRVFCGLFNLNFSNRVPDPQIVQKWIILIVDHSETRKRPVGQICVMIYIDANLIWMILVLNAYIIRITQLEVLNLNS